VLAIKLKMLWSTAGSRQAENGGYLWKRDGFLVEKKFNNITAKNVNR